MHMQFIPEPFNISILFTSPVYAQILGNQEYALLVITMLIVTGMIRTLVVHFYDPSRRYTVQNRSTIQDSPATTSIYESWYASWYAYITKTVSLPSETSLKPRNPTHHSPISVLFLTLVERGTRRHGRNHTRPKFPQRQTHLHMQPLEPHIKHLQLPRAGKSRARLFAALNAVAPYSSMHDDVCTLALDHLSQAVGNWWNRRSYFPLHPDRKPCNMVLISTY